MQSFSKFFSVPNYCISCCATEKRITRGGGFGLEVPNDSIYFMELLKHWNG